jgi:hypothetical protein
MHYPPTTARKAILSTRKGADFEFVFKRASAARLKVEDEVGNEVPYTVDNGNAQIYWFDGLHTVFLQEDIVEPCCGCGDSACPGC